MKSFKIFGSAAIAAALIALTVAGTASATTVQSSGTEYSGTVKVKLNEGTEAILKSSFIGEVKCKESTVEGKVEKQGTEVTASGSISSLTFTSCNGTVTVLKDGSLEVHTDSALADGNGILTSNGAEVTTELSGLHCIFTTSNTNLGTVTGGTPATFTAKSVAIPRSGGRTGAFCGSSATWDAKYRVSSPSNLTVDGGGKTSTATTTSLSGESKSGAEITVNEGSKVKDTATLSGTNAGKATGNVKYKVYADKECKELATSAGEVTVSEGKVPASEEKLLEAGRVYYWQAEYSGDSSNEASKSSCGGEVLTVKASTSLATSLSGESKSGEEITVNEGSKAKDTATLSGTRSSAATGKVKFKAYKDKECKELASEAGEGSLSEGKASSEEKALEAGAVYYWQAQYPGDSLHQASTSSCAEKLTVRAATSLTTLLSGQSEEEESTEGEEITVTESTEVKEKASLSGTNVATASGDVKYSIYSDKECKELVASAGEGIVEGTKVGNSAEEELEGEATYYWQAEYVGDALHQPSATCGGQFVLVQTFKYRSQSYPTSFSGGTVALENEIFGFNGALVACHQEGIGTGGIYTGGLTAPSESLKIKPGYGNCGSLNGLGESGEFDPHGCEYELGRPKKAGATFVANVSIVCPELRMSYESSNFGMVRCIMRIGSQANVAKFVLKNVSTPEPVRKYLRIEPTLVNLSYSVTLSEDPVECGSNVEDRNDGTYQGKFVLGGPGQGADLYIGP